MAVFASGERWPSSGGMTHCTKIPLEMVQRNVYCALQHIQRNYHMADETKIQAQAAAEAPAKVVEAVAETAATIASESAKTAKRTRVATARRAKRVAAAAPKAALKAAPRRAKNSHRKAINSARKTVRVAKQRTEPMTNNTFFKGFEAVPAFAPFQSMFADAGDRSQDLAKKSQKVAEELADLARANVEAVVEAGRVASEGVRSLGQDVVAKQRDSFEQAADAIRSLAEAKSPTEYLQLQGDFARASFDRLVAESSKLTETMVKLAGEAFQPLSNRATANAERFNTLVA
jgi:phasin family protein